MRAPAMAPDAVLRRSIVGLIGVALTELEVSAAAMAASRTAAEKALTGYSTASAGSGERLGKTVKTDADATAAGVATAATAAAQADADI